MKRTFLATGLLLLPLLLLLDRGSTLLVPGAFALLLAALSGATRALLRPLRLPTLLRVAIPLLLLIIWARFWLLDLHRAQFRWILLALPIAALGGSALTARVWGARLGGAIALSWILVRMLLRSDNGCTGVSEVFGDTLGWTALVLYGLGPWWVLPRLDDS